MAPSVVYDAAAKDLNSRRLRLETPKPSKLQYPNPQDPATPEP